MASMWMRWRDLFTEDAVCEFGPDYGGDWVGKAQIRANFQQWSLGEGDPYSVLHAVTNPLIRLIDETTAHGRWYLLDLRTTEGGGESADPVRHLRRRLSQGGRQLADPPHPHRLPLAEAARR